MSIFDNIKAGVQNHFKKQKEEREWMENLRREAEAQRRLTFEEEFKKNALEVAKAKAKKDAANLSGLRKLRAMNRARRLTEHGQGENLLSKFSAYTQKNLAQRDENIKRTAELREAGKSMQKEKLATNIKEREQRMANRKPFGQSNWKM